MKKTILVCDNCGSTDNVKTITLTLGRQCDPCDGMVDLVETVELCFDCIFKSFKSNYISKLSVDEQNKLYEQIMSNAIRRNGIENAQHK